MKLGRLFMLLFTASLSGAMIVYGVKTFSRGDIRHVKYEITFNNGDKDTIEYNGPYKMEYLETGDFKVSTGLERSTIASGVRSYKVIIK